MGLPATPYLLVVKASRDLLLEFWDPSITRERFKLETWNTARILTWRALTIKIQ